MAVLIIAIVVVSGVLGWLGQRHLGRRRERDAEATAEGINASDLLNPMRTLVALLLAFVLVETYSSFRDARQATTNEAVAVAAEMQLASVLPAPQAAEVTGALVCYARAVVGPSWRSLERSRHTSAITDRTELYLANAIGHATQVDANATVLSELLTTEHDRAEARRVRLDEALPSVPSVVTFLMIGFVAATVAATAALADRRIRRSLRVSIVVLTAVILTATLLVIFDLDRPFGGVATLEPTAMQTARQQLEASPLAANAPCNADGALN